MKPLTRPLDDLDELLRGATEVIGRDELAAKLAAGKRLIVKHGVDATAKDLHLGYSVCYQVMRRLQDAGHTVVLLIGDFTTRIGDPEGKDKMRPQLSEDQIEANIESMLTQVDRVLDVKSLVIKRNSEWLAQMDLDRFLSLAAKLSAVRLWDRDMFRGRLENGQTVFLHEFLYPVLQGYDSYMLQSDITVNGSDQRFNELMGREIQSLYGQSPQAIALMPLLIGTDGKQKMSQSLGNYIGLSEPPGEQYGKVMSIPDELIEDYFRLCTRMPSGEIDEIVSAVQEGRGNPMTAKMRLAHRLVSEYHGEAEAEAAQGGFETVHRRRHLPASMPEYRVSREALPITLSSVLKESGFAPSAAAARRLIHEGAVRLDGTKVTQVAFALEEPGELVLQMGKRHFLRVRVGDA